jgi:hypothetical protein
MSDAAEIAIEKAVQSFEYLSDYKILVCKEHGFGLRNLRRHLLEQHACSKNVRDAIIDHFASWDINSPEDAPLSTSVVERFGCLQAPRLALRCAGWAHSV